MPDQSTPVPSKPAWQSKTLWMNLIGALAVIFWPAAGDFVAQNPEVVMAAWAAINMVLRWVTKGAVQIS